MINKKILSVLAMGLILSNITPIITNATTIEYDKYGHTINNNYDKNNYDKYGNIIDNNGNISNDNKDKPNNDNNSSQEKTDNYVNSDTDESAPIGTNEQNPLFTIKDYVVPEDALQQNNVQYNFDKLYTEKYNKDYENVNITEISGSGSIRNEELLTKYPVLVHVSKDSMVPVEYSKRTTSKINKALKLLQEANDGKSMDKLYKAVNVMSNLVAIMPNDEVRKHTTGDQIDYFYIEAIYLGFNLTDDGAERNKYFSSFMDNSYIATAKRYNNGLQIAMLEKYTNYLGWHLDSYFSDENTKNTLQAGASIMFSMSNVSLSDDNILSTLKHELPEGYVFNEKEPPTILAYEPPRDTSDNKFVSEVPYSHNTTTATPENDYSINYDGDYFISESTDFKKINNECYKIVYRYDSNGVLIATTDEKLDVFYNSFCGIGQESDIKLEDWNDNHGSRNNLEDEIWGALEDNNKNEDSNRTLQFTLDKNQENPYYYDTGLKVSLDDTTTFNQIKSLLNQIAIKAKGYMVNDKDKALIIVDGTPVVSIKKDTEYTSDDLKEMFAPLEKINIKIDTIKSNKTDVDLALKERNLKQFRLYGDIINLSNPIVIESKIIKMPIAEIGKSLNYTIDETQNKVILKKIFYGKDIEIEYTKGSNNVVVSGTKILLNSDTTVENGVLYGDATMVVRILGLGIYVDEIDNFTEIK